MFGGTTLRSLGTQMRQGRRIEFTRGAWIAAIGFLFTFALISNAIAVANDITGPFELLATDFVGRAQIGEIKIAGLLLALVCLPSRLRLPVIGVAATIELLWNAQRLFAGNELTVGNGILFTLVGTAAYAAWRLRGPEQASTLKAAGLGLLLIVMGRVGDVWLVLSSRANPSVLDEFVEMADRALGSPAWAVGSVVSESPILTEIFSKVYVYLPVGAAIIAFFQLRNSARDGFPRHHIIRTFLLIGMIGPLIYFVFPVVGPTYAFGHELAGAGWQDVWPLHLPIIGDPESAPFAQAVARNCMPSLHTAWATCILIHGWRGSTVSKIFGTLWLVCTTGATLGFGFHYGIDILAGIIFTLTLEAALTRPELGWSWHRAGVIAFGATAFSGVLLSTRFLSVELAVSGAVGGLALLGVVLAVAIAFLTVELHPGDQRAFDGPRPPTVGQKTAEALREVVGSARRWTADTVAMITPESKKTESTKL
ncbi:MAG: phosphatase PAP2 family protein [Gordonia sp. (in: high G+C Gram-positive bacteria)]|uniref:phosphatase PAP2 family protein n=1 Tax=Gordonia sp. (in: high G+C Gram-positive bacteria) TaxID=84139 RepID=UPI003C796961